MMIPDDIVFADHRIYGLYAPKKTKTDRDKQDQRPIHTDSHTPFTNQEFSGNTRKPQKKSIISFSQR